MTVKLTLTVLCDNLAKAPLRPEHGLALWLQGPDLALLLDCGSGETLQHNAEQLAIPLAACQRVILSHGHYDHSGGLVAFWAQGGECPILAHPDALLPRYSHHPDKPVRGIGMPRALVARLSALAESQRQWRTKPEKLTAYLGTSGEIPRHDPYEDVGGPFFLDESGQTADRLQDDQALWLSTPRGLVILLGCCHAGLINTLQHLQRITGIQRVAGIIGGVHLLHAGEARLAHTLQFLRDCSPDFIWLGHCSGKAVMTRLRHELPRVDVQLLHVGARYVLVGDACSGA